MRVMNRPGKTVRRAVRGLVARAALFACAAASAHSQELPPPSAPPQDPPRQAQEQPAATPPAATPPAVPAPEPRPAAPPAHRAAAPATSGAASAPADLRDVNAWVAWKNAQQIVALPTEARLFYRRGLIARQSGQTPEALANVRGAIDLDPSFLAPHLTLAGWFLLTDPAQTLQHCAVIVDRIRRDFTVQLDVVANVLGLGLEALFVGLLFAGLVIALQRREQLAHALHEHLSTYISPVTARWWVPLILALPFLAGAGLTLPVLALLGYLWLHLRVRERVL